MRTIESNGIKIYELSKGTAVPEYLASRRKQKLKKKQQIMKSQLEIIHDLTMPDISTNISISPDQKYMFILGAYKPRIRCYELEQLSMKFERYCDQIPKKIAYIDNDYSKFVVLEGERTLSFHSAGGVHKVVQCNNVVTDLIYSPFKTQLFVPDCKGIITLLNLETGKMSSNIFDSNNAMPINCAAYNDIADYFFTGHDNGYISGFDPRTADKIALINVNNAPKSEYVKKSYVPEISKIAFKDPLKMGVGLDKGMFHLYDIRNYSRPYSSRDLDYEFPIRSIMFHEEKVIAAVHRVVKIWEPLENNEGQIIASFNAESVINDLFQFPNSGLFFAAMDKPQIESYFIPSIGDAPAWCQNLSNLIVNVEAESQSMYDTHTFVTFDEISELGLQGLIGTPNLRAYMHGYYISNETYKRAKNARQAAKMSENVVEKVINYDLRRTEEIDDTPDPDFNVALKSVMGDNRFSDLFTSESFVLDPNCRVYNQVALDVRRLEKKKRKKMLLKSKAKKSKQIANDEASEDESLDHSD